MQEQSSGTSLLHFSPKQDFNLHALVPSSLKNWLLALHSSSAGVCNVCVALANWALIARPCTRSKASPGTSTPQISHRWMPFVYQLVDP